MQSNSHSRMSSMTDDDISLPSPHTSQEGEATMTDDKQSQHRTGVGMSLCLVKHSRIDMMNLVRELNKVHRGTSATSKVPSFAFTNHTQNTKTEIALLLEFVSQGCQNRDVQQIYIHEVFLSC